MMVGDAGGTGGRGCCEGGTVSFGCGTPLSVDVLGDMLGEPGSTRTDFGDDLDSLSRNPAAIKWRRRKRKEIDVTTGTGKENIPAGANELSETSVKDWAPCLVNNV